MRPEVERFAALGAFPAEGAAAVHDLAERQRLLERIGSPVDADEARSLVGVLGESEDSCFGLKWGVVHLIETAPGWPLEDALAADTPWVRLLADRAGPGPSDPPER